MASGTLLQCPQSGQTVTHVPGLNCQPCPRTVPICALTCGSTGPPASVAGGYPRRFAPRRPVNRDVRGQGMVLAARTQNVLLSIAVAFVWLAHLVSPVQLGSSASLLLRSWYQLVPQS